MALQELSNSVGRLEPRRSLSHMIELSGKAKSILVHMNVIASDSSFITAILLACCFIVRVADGLEPSCRKVRAEQTDNSIVNSEEK